MNCFGVTLKNLILKTQIKNATVAKYVQYDVSYISKWLTGKSLPAERYMESICTDISRCIMESADEICLKSLMEEYGIEQVDLLQTSIKEILLQAYEQCRKEGNIAGACPGTLFTLMDLLPQVINKIQFLKWQRKNEKIENELTENVAVLADVFFMGHESRLHLASIQNGRFALVEPMKNINMLFVLDLDSVNDYIYDTVFLIHMLTSYSSINFQVYDNKIANGKLFFANDNKEFLSSILIQENQSVSVNYSKNNEMSHEMYKHIRSFCTQERLLFQLFKMNDFLLNKLYIQSVISSRLEWLTGHITEQLIPENLFEEILETTYFGECNNELFTQMQYIKTLLRGVYETVDIKVLIYSAAFSKLIITGELDFFNNKIILNNKQRRQCLNYLKELIDSELVEIKIINGNLCNDFQYISDPCVFLSDTIGYIRLENGRYEDSLLMIKNNKIRDLFDCFYSEVWNNRKDIVIDDKEKMLKIIDEYLIRLKMISLLER